MQYINCVIQLYNNGNNVKERQLNIMQRGIIGTFASMVTTTFQTGCDVIAGNLPAFHGL